MEKSGKMLERKNSMVVSIAVLCIIGWSLMSESSNIRGFQYIKIWLPKLFNVDFSVKTSEFR